MPEATRGPEGRRTILALGRDGIGKRQIAGFLLSLPESTSGDRAHVMAQKLDAFAKHCQQKGIQVVLAPVRYEKDIKDA